MRASGRAAGCVPTGSFLPPGSAAPQDATERPYRWLARPGARAPARRASAPEAEAPEVPGPVRHALALGLRGEPSRTSDLGAEARRPAGCSSGTPLQCLGTLEARTEVRPGRSPGKGMRRSVPAEGVGEHGAGGLPPRQARDDARRRPADQLFDPGIAGHVGSHAERGLECPGGSPGTGTPTVRSDPGRAG